ncbi:MAG: phosphatidylglycerophosphatase A [Candidatus Aminicenantes bacterium]|nr:phosphatidylglycerophosphatase A [Candidatus Aminicenantes bacterium]
MKILIKIMATFGGFGYLPLAPGSVASSVFLLLRRFCLPYSPSIWEEISLFLIIFFSGVWASEQFSRLVNKSDPRQIVIDEVCGQHLSIITLPPSTLNLIFAFILFRGLDIIKPFPIKKIEKIRGGWGIMADDLAAGLLARFLLEIYRLIS